MKKGKATKQFHTPNSKSGVGDYYGSGIRNPVGKPVDTYGPDGLPKIKKTLAPKKLA